MPSCLNFIRYRAAECLTMPMHGWKCLPTCRRNWPHGLERLPRDDATTSVKPYRPKTIAVVASFLFAATIIAFITGESLLFPNALLDKLWKFNPEGAALFHSIGRLSGVFLLALGVGTFFAALGLLG